MRRGPPHPMSAWAGQPDAPRPLRSCARAGTCGVGAGAERVLLARCLKTGRTLPWVWLQPPAATQDPRLPRWPAGLSGAAPPGQGRPCSPPAPSVTTCQADVAARPTAWPRSRPALARSVAGRVWRGPASLRAPGTARAAVLPAAPRAPARRASL